MTGPARERGFALPAKRVLARALTSQPVGKVVAFVTGDQIPNNGIVFDTVHPAFSPSIKAAMLFRTHESAEIRFVRKYLGPDVDVVELGSGLGVTSAHILDRLSPGRSLTCVEANPDLLPALRRTVDAAQARSHRGATILHGAISGAPTRERERTVGLAVTASSLGSTVVGHDSSSHTVMEVQRVSLSTLVRGLGDYSLVIDIEGAEVFLMNEEADVLSNARQIVIELHPTQYAGRRISVAEMAGQLLNDLGFRLVDQRGPVLACVRSASH
jgi:FkbM family methyltransferase